jgi:hypothetical protein
MQQLKDLSLRNWKRIGATYEPVGCVVMVLTASGEVLRAFRNTPAESYGKPNEYLTASSEEVLRTPLYWDYA